MSSCQAQRRTAEVSLEASLHPADHLAMTLLVYWKGAQGHCTTSSYTMSNRDFNQLCAFRPYSNRLHCSVHDGTGGASVLQHTTLGKP